MIARVAGRLAAKDIDRIEVMTGGGTGYELAVPLSVYESLPAIGGDVSLYTHLVVKDDGWQLFGFTTPLDRRLFRALLGAKGVGPALALALLSALNAERLVRAIRERDIATLQTVPRVGRKKAEQLVLDLADKLDEMVVAPTGTPVRGADDAVRGLVSLGYARVDAEQAVRLATDGAGGGMETADVIRKALKSLAGGR